MNTVKWEDLSKSEQVFLADLWFEDDISDTQKSVAFDDLIRMGLMDNDGDKTDKGIDVVRDARNKKYIINRELHNYEIAGPLDSPLLITVRNRRKE
jgi:hypothetical protein